LNYENFEVVVVDNGSTDDSAKIIAENYSKVILILNKENLGFAGGSNVGIRYALDHGAEYIWLLNNDTVVAPDALFTMVAEIEKDPKIGITGSKIYYLSHPKKIWFAGGEIDWLNGTSHHTGMEEVDIGKYDYTKEVDRVTGCSMLVRRDVCDKVGIFDEQFFIYVEEVDWCVRARKPGFKCIFVPSSVVYHKQSISVSRVGNPNNVFRYYNTRNFLYLIKKSFSFPFREIILLKVLFLKVKHQKVNLLKMLLSLVCPSFKLKPGESPILFAVRDFLKRKMGRVDYKF